MQILESKALRRRTRNGSLQNLRPDDFHKVAERLFTDHDDGELNQ